MNTTLIVLGILGIIIMLIPIIISFRNEYNDYCIFGFGLGIFCSILIVIIVYSQHINAIDVYRGKTTLEITYKDNIPIDSVVVYKK